ncbi:MAG: sulfite exporter TauE/SafE family protein [Clostridia bacterium]|nr:sulfite exporter TauE/SafE family protein [Clostridia bacterium]
MLKYLIICPLVFLAGFIDAIAGGGGLISLPAYSLAGLPLHAAVATNKMSSTMGTSIATAKYAKSGFIPWKLAPFGAGFAYLGSVLGANLALRTGDKAFKIILLCVLPVTAFYVLKKKHFDENKEELPFKKACLIASGIAFAVGIYDGFYGPGTGTFLILLLTGLGHMELKNANGLTKVINLTSNIAALTVYLINGQVLLLLGITAGLFNIAGNYLGARCFEKNSAGFAKPVTLVVLVIFWCKLIYETLF